MLSRRRHRVCAAACAAVAALGGCGDGGESGDSDDDDAEIRALAKQFSRSAKRDSKRDCARLTDRAKAQALGLLGGFTGAPDCERLWAKTEADDASYSAADVDRAALQIRGDRALLKLPGDDGERMGLRKVGGRWKVDNILNATLDEPERRSDPRLARGSDEQQIRATLIALRDAFKEKDYARACALYSYGAEAQLVVARLFAGRKDMDDQDLSCAASFRALEEAEGEPLPSFHPSDADVSHAVVSVDGGRASVKLPAQEEFELVRQEGRWLVGPSRDE